MALEHSSLGAGHPKQETEHLPGTVSCVSGLLCAESSAVDAASWQPRSSWAEPCEAAVHLRS